MLPNSSTQLLDMYLRHAAMFNAPAVTCAWDRCVPKFGPGRPPFCLRAAVLSAAG